MNEKTTFEEAERQLTRWARAGEMHAEPLAAAANVIRQLKVLRRTAPHLASLSAGILVMMWVTSEHRYALRIDADTMAYLVNDATGREVVRERSGISGVLDPASVQSTLNEMMAL